MFDTGLRDLERRWMATGNVDDERRFLAERVRQGQLSNRVLLRAALFGSPAALLAIGGSPEADDSPLTQDEMNEVLRLVFGGIDLPQRTREFLENIVQHDREARSTLTHYELVQARDKAPPDSATALKALMDDLKENQNHREAIAQMNRPVLQFVPVYEPEGAGFQRMVNAYNSHIPQRLREILEERGLDPTFTWQDLQARWEMNSETPGKVVGWQVAVVEGAKVLPRGSNPYAGQPVEEQLTQSREDARRQDLQLCDKKKYDLLQMREIQQATPETPLEQLGIDPQNWTILEDPTREHGSFVPSGNWSGSQVYFDVSNPGSQDEDARFRFAVVVDIP